jgi:hypothetical protein
VGHGGGRRVAGTAKHLIGVMGVAVDGRLFQVCHVVRYWGR